MIKVGLHGAEFFAYHGFYPEEQILGNKFILDIEVGFEPTTNLISDQIGDTVNYEQLYTIAEQEMKQTRQLLETVAKTIVNRIRAEHPFVETIHVELKKLNPPLKGRVAYSSVTVSSLKKILRTEK